jgi:hypothetical protein
VTRRDRGTARVDRLPTFADGAHLSRDRPADTSRMAESKSVWLSNDFKAHLEKGSKRRAATSIAWMPFPNERPPSRRIRLECDWTSPSCRIARNPQRRLLRWIPVSSRNPSSTLRPRATVCGVTRGNVAEQAATALVAFLTVLLSVRTIGYRGEQLRQRRERGSCQPS